jgi:hypothetical protein
MRPRVWAFDPITGGGHSGLPIAVTPSNATAAR